MFLFFIFIFFLCYFIPSFKLEREPELKKNDTLHDLQVPGKGRIYWSTNLNSFTTRITQVCFFWSAQVWPGFPKSKLFFFFFPFQTLPSNQQGKLEGSVWRKVAQLPHESECFGRIVAIGRFLFMRSPICSDSGVMLRASGDSGQSGLSLDAFPLPTELRRSGFPPRFGLRGKDGILNPCPQPVI